MPTRSRARRIIRDLTLAAHAAIHVYAWACNVGTTWIATPRSIRHYLRHAGTHERMLAATGSRQPRRGVRTVPGSGLDQLLVAATSR